MNPNDNSGDSSNAESIDERQRIIDAITTRAYFLWVEAGRPMGRDDDFWFQAEAEYRERQAR